MMIPGRRCRAAFRVVLTLGLILTSGAMIASDETRSMSTEAIGPMDGQVETQTASGKILVPKRVRLIIDFKQTVPA